jgi:hypothetical protein
MSRTIGTKTLRDRCEEILRLIDETLEVVPVPSSSVLPVRVDGRHRVPGR